MCNHPTSDGILATVEHLFDVAPTETRAAIVAALGGQTVWSDPDLDNLITSVMRERLASYAPCACGRAVWRCGICRSRRRDTVREHRDCRTCAACLAVIEARRYGIAPLPE